MLKHALRDPLGPLAPLVPDAPGSGRVEWSAVGGRTALTRCRANSPLKLLAPRSGGRSSWVVASTYGGGLVAGDRIELDLAAGPGTACFLGTQASTKVYRSPAGIAARQSLTASVAAGAVLVVGPDPVTCFAGAVYEQRQRFDVAAGGGLVVLDWLTSGRRAVGERWAFGRCDARLDVRVGGRRVLYDALRLDPADGPIAGAGRMGRFDCYGSVVMAGDLIRPAAGAALQFVGGLPVRRGDGLIVSASPLAGGGVVLRFAGTDAEQAGAWARERLGFVSGLLGADPWGRKF